MIDVEEKNNSHESIFIWEILDHRQSLTKGCLCNKDDDDDNDNDDDDDNDDHHSIYPFDLSLSLSIYLHLSLSKHDRHWVLIHPTGILVQTLWVNRYALIGCLYLQKILFLNQYTDNIYFYSFKSDQFTDSSFKNNY